MEEQEEGENLRGDLFVLEMSCTLKLYLDKKLKNTIKY